MMERQGKAVLTLYVFMLLMVPVTSQVSCNSPPQPFGTTHSGGDTTVFLVKATVIYTCSLGYNPVGNTTRECRENGTWTGDDDVCRIDAASLVLACGAGLGAILIFTTLSCCLIVRSQRIKHRAERRLTIQREPQAVADIGLSGPAAKPTRNVYATSSKTSDSGLQIDLDNMEEINLDDFNQDEQVESPSDNPSIEDEW